MVCKLCLLLLLMSLQIFFSYFCSVYCCTCLCYNVFSCCLLCWLLLLLLFLLFVFFITVAPILFSLIFFVSSVHLFCLFWYESSFVHLRTGNKISGQWSSEGCEFDKNESTPGHTVCRCNHLTNFALLLQRRTDVSLIYLSCYILLSIVKTSRML